MSSFDKSEGHRSVANDQLDRFFTRDTFASYLNPNIAQDWLIIIDKSENLTLSVWVQEAVDTIYSIMGGNQYILDKEFEKEGVNRNMWLVGRVSDLVNYRCAQILSLRSNDTMGVFFDAYENTLSILMEIAKGERRSPIAGKNPDELQNFNTLSTEESVDLHTP